MIACKCLFNLAGTPEHRERQRARSPFTSVQRAPHLLKLFASQERRRQKLLCLDQLHRICFFQTSPCDSLRISSNMSIHCGSNTHFIPNIPGWLRMWDPFDPHSSPGRPDPDIPHEESHEYPAWGHPEVMIM